jgi:hypothetical protein
MDRSIAIMHLIAPIVMTEAMTATAAIMRRTIIKATMTTTRHITIIVTTTITRLTAAMAMDPHREEVLAADEGEEE